MRLQSLDDVFACQLADLYSAETQLSVALPRVTAAAEGKHLRWALGEHSNKSRLHISRLAKIFAQLEITSQSEHRCEAMAGLLADREKLMNAEGDASAKDVALIGASQRVGHYEIAAYSMASTLADELGHDDAKELLKTTLREESDAEKLLRKIATGRLSFAGRTQEARDTEAVTA